MYFLITARDFLDNILSRYIIQKQSEFQLMEHRPKKLLEQLSDVQSHPREMVEQSCSEWQEGSPTEMTTLKIYWRLGLKQLKRQVALLFYHSNLTTKFSESFLLNLSKFGKKIVIITEQRCENLPCFSPNTPDLLDAIIRLLKWMILED